MHPADLRMDPAAAQAVLQQFVALGYIQPPSEDQEKAVETAVREQQLQPGARIHGCAAIFRCVNPCCRSWLRRIRMKRASCSIWRSVILAIGPASRCQGVAAEVNGAEAEAPASPKAQEGGAKAEEQTAAEHGIVAEEEKGVASTPDSAPEAGSPEPEADSPRQSRVPGRIC